MNSREGLSTSSEEESSYSGEYESVPTLGLGFSGGSEHLIFSLSGPNDEVVKYAREIIFNYVQHSQHQSLYDISNWNKMNPFSKGFVLSDDWAQVDFTILTKNKAAIENMLWCIYKTTGARPQPEMGFRMLGRYRTMHSPYDSVLASKKVKGAELKIMEVPAITYERAAKDALKRLDEPFEFKFANAKVMFEHNCGTYYDKIPLNLMTDAEQVEYLTLQRQHDEARQEALARQELERKANEPGWVDSVFSFFSNAAETVNGYLQLEKSDEERNNNNVKPN